MELQIKENGKIVKTIDLDGILLVLVGIIGMILGFAFMRGDLVGYSIISLGCGIVLIRREFKRLKRVRLRK